MEEILASIKRVIAEDGARPATQAGRVRPARKPVEPEQPATAPEPEAAVDEDDVLELSDPLPPDPGLISENVTAATRQSLAALAAVKPRHFEPESREGPLEAVVKEMLRPMLKEWLDTRLPEMVEDMVAKEIARITGKRG